MTGPLDINGPCVQRRAVEALFGLLEQMCEGAVSVDHNARIVWINDKYRALLGIDPQEDVIGRDIETVIPESMMRHVVETGRPILLDIMKFSDQNLVVSRLPLSDERGRVIGAIGFVLYDRVDHLKPILAKFERLQAELSRTHQKLDEERRAKYSFSNFIGLSVPAVEVKRVARRCALHDSPVLILGETGTGKELLAQAIHAGSARATGPFVAVNTAAIPETLLESEFFGAAPGAFTGADRRARDGKFQVADGGTLFLDEIGDMPLPLQAKLLRAIESKQIEPLGSNRLKTVDIRILAATSQDLARKVAAGTFRSDLFYRLNVLTVRVPPLRERLADLGPLAEHLLEQIARSSREPQRELEPDALDVLGRHHWPGNVRELRNVLERACVAADTTTITANDVRTVLGTAALAFTAVGASPLAVAVAEKEREAITAALKVAGGKKSAAARLLGISRSSLYERLRMLGLS
ncbi:MAG: PAS domain-containing protein [Hyphomicrobiaceae bacterium]|nr:MAG: PAS domain-containing protein [Hyphomicrobiaceae bacterium]